MKHISALLLLLLAMSNSQAQKIDSVSLARLNPALRAEANDYLREAKKAQRTGIAMVAGGGAVMLAGAVMVLVEGSKGYLDLVTLGTDPELDYNEGVANAGLVMFVAGAGCALSSIIMFRKVHRKRNAARAIVFADRNISMTPNLVLPHTRTVGVKLTVGF